MSELLALPVSPASETATPYVPNAASMHAKLVKADYHGSLITGALFRVNHEEIVFISIIASR
jgi:hypothetical protein